MDKKFYIVLPYFFTNLQGVSGGKQKEEGLNKGINILNQRTVALESALKNMGINCMPLDTSGLIELFYISYNPGTVKLTNPEGATSLDRPIVKTNFEPKKGEDV